MTDGYEVCLCDIKQEFADGGKGKILKNLNFLVGKEKITQEKADAIAAKDYNRLKGHLHRLRSGRRSCILKIWKLRRHTFAGADKLL